MSFTKALTSSFRDSSVGVCLHYLSRGRLFPHQEQRNDFVVPPIYLPRTSRNSTLKCCNDLHAEGSDLNGCFNSSCTLADPEDCRKGTIGDKTFEKEKIDPNLVDWYGSDDEENPQNWSFAKKALTTCLIMSLTWSVYIGSAIYASSIPGVAEEFEVSTTKSTLGLSLFILGYGIGPMILSPLSEIPSIGRNPTYLITLLLFVIFQIPAVATTNYSVLMAMRFFNGFFASPALSTGGATLSDIWSPEKVPYAISCWSVASFLAPVMGPVISAFPVEANGWKWSLYELLWISSFCLLLVALFLPETYSATILLKRSRRLRKLTGNEDLRSQSELDQAHLSAANILFENLVRPFQLLTEPVVFFVDFYIALLYGVFYLWQVFEAFPLVFVGIHGFDGGISGLPFLGIGSRAILTFVAHVAYQRYYVETFIVRTGTWTPEHVLQIGLIGSIFPPISLFLFGWLSRKGIHWIAPVIASALNVPGLYLIFQSCTFYVVLSYPRFAASLLAGSALFRSLAGALFPLVANAMYRHLGLGGGCSLLAGVSILMIPILWVFYKKGPQIRAYSRYAS
ncbi:MFS general substrate transporter [Atractiella rhizophila]|nr:MFS general substrate transporter [Atractiella rhizophila]